MLDLTAYQAIVFDMDGTLIDSMGSHGIAWRQTCERYGYPFDPVYMHNLGGVPTDQTVVLLNEKYGLSHDVREVAQLKRELWEKLDEVPSLIPATVELLQHYSGRLKIGIGTGADRSHALKMLQQTGLLALVDTVVTATDVDQGKPHPETFLTVAAQLGVAPQHCVVFEDTAIGQQAAAAAGMDCILVQNGELQF
ncbi:HAD family phosphatase [Rheinheimera sp.]|uniref:HAD family hydrolase n=1 Tax=Rheinheimera sp. TaxID=1869214 RepID=UPI0027BAD4E4|nr:beta-phosphoglucomutase family hydrolase [Rheinheimera sp.]